MTSECISNCDYANCISASIEASRAADATGTDGCACVKRSRDQYVTGIGGGPCQQRNFDLAKVSIGLHSHAAGGRRNRPVILVAAKKSLDGASYIDRRIYVHNILIL